MDYSSQYLILKKSSKTFFYSSKFLPQEIRDEVAVLYAFLRTVDNFVDEIPSQSLEYHAFKNEYYKALRSGVSENSIIREFINLKNKKEFEDIWIDSLFHSMEMDLNGRSYDHIEQTVDYIHGVAEVVGFMMSRILNLQSEAYYAAQMLGRAVQYGNIIRDISEDNSLKRLYFPKTDFESVGLVSLDEAYVKENKEKFLQFMQIQFDRYFTWLEEAKKGFSFIPLKYLITVKTASDMYEWTINEIRKDPFHVYEGKIKPSKKRVIMTALKNFIVLRHNSCKYVLKLKFKGK
jgi:phytoene synthase